MTLYGISWIYFNLVASFGAQRIEIESIFNFILSCCFTWLTIWLLNHAINSDARTRQSRIQTLEINCLCRIFLFTLRLRSINCTWINNWRRCPFWKYSLQYPTFIKLRIFYHSLRVGRKFSVRYNIRSKSSSQANVKVVQTSREYKAARIGTVYKLYVAVYV